VRKLNDSENIGIINIDSNHYEVTMYKEYIGGGSSRKMVKVTLNNVTVIEYPFTRIHSQRA